MGGMKWWGWGHEHVSFAHDDKPDLAPFIRGALDVDVTRPSSRPVAFEKVEVPESGVGPDLLAALE